MVPPNMVPLTWTDSASRPMIGNWPWASSAGAIRMPCTDPENSRPERPLIPVTLAESTRTKLPGSFSMSSHWMPIESIRTGRNAGHLKLSPVAAPTPRKTPKPGRASKVPSPRNAKLRASPLSSRVPIRMTAPTETKDTRSWLAEAPVFSRKSFAVSVTKSPILTPSVSMVSWNESTLPLVKVSCARMASSLGLPSGFLSSAVSRSLIVALIDLSGNSVAPPEAM